VETDSPGARGTDSELGRFPLSADGARDAAERLSARLHGELGCAHDDPLFVGLTGINSGDGASPRR